MSRKKRPVRKRDADRQRWLDHWRFRGDAQDSPRVRIKGGHRIVKK